MNQPMNKKESKKKWKKENKEGRKGYWMWKGIEWKKN